MQATRRWPRKTGTYCTEEQYTPVREYLHLAGLAALAAVIGDVTRYRNPWGSVRSLPTRYTPSPHQLSFMSYVAEVVPRTAWR